MLRFEPRESDANRVKVYRGNVYMGDLRLREREFMTSGTAEVLPLAELESIVKMLTHLDGHDRLNGQELNHAS